MKYLFVDKKNISRGPTLERYCRENYGRFGHSFRSRGIHADEENGGKPLELEDVLWADEIWVMVPSMAKDVKSHNFMGKVRILNIKKSYERRDANLLMAIFEKVGLDDNTRLYIRK